MRARTRGRACRGCLRRPGGSQGRSQCGSSSKYHHAGGRTGGAGVGLPRAGTGLSLSKGAAQACPWPASSGQAALLHDALHGGPHLRGGVGHRDTRRLQGPDLILRRALATWRGRGGCAGECQCRLGARSSVALHGSAASQPAAADPYAMQALLPSPAQPSPQRSSAPEMMAPAWPMRRPGGAVRPAMKETTGLVVPLARMKSAASSSALPPISPAGRGVGPGRWGWHEAGAGSWLEWRAPASCCRPHYLFSLAPRPACSGPQPSTAAHQS